MGWPFESAARPRPDGSYEMGTVLLDLTVLVDAPAGTRRARVSLRAEVATLDRWHRRWDAAEAHSFPVARPPDSCEVSLPS